MAIRKLQWSDFVVYTCTSNAEDIHVERIHFDPICWASLKVKLVDFYLFAMVPELLTTQYNTIQYNTISLLVCPNRDFQY